MARKSKEVSKLKDGELQERLNRREAALEQLRAADDPGRGLARTEAETARSQHLHEMKATATEIVELRAERAARPKRAAREQFERDAAMLRGAGTIHQRLAAAEERERLRDEEREARRRELDEKRAVEAQKRHKQLVKAGRAYEPVGGWDRDAADALAALFSSSYLWEASVAGRGRGDHLTIEQVIRAWWALNLIAENGGEAVTFQQNRPPRGGISTSFSEADLRHLSDLGLVRFVKAGGLITLSRGPRLEDLRRSFAEEFERRARTGATDDSTDPIRNEK